MKRATRARDRSLRGGPDRATREALALALLLGGCSSEVLHGLDERAANEVVAALAEAGVDADKAGDERPRTFKVLVPRGQQVQAVRALEGRDLPRHVGKGVGEALADPGLLPSPEVERARLGAALAIDTERALEAVPGVTAARVRLSLPPPEAVRPDGARPRASASVLLRVRGLPAMGEDEIRRLVTGGVEGLHADDVQVSVLPEPEPSSGPRAGALLRVGPLWLSPGSIGLMLAALVLAIVGLVAALAALRWRRP